MKYLVKFLCYYLEFVSLTFLVEYVTVVAVFSSNTIHISANLFAAVFIIALMFSYFSGVERLQHCADERFPTANEGDVVVAVYNLFYIFIVVTVENVGTKMYFRV